MVPCQLCLEPWSVLCSIPLAYQKQTPARKTEKGKPETVDFPFALVKEECFWNVSRGEVMLKSLSLLFVSKEDENLFCFLDVPLKNQLFIGVKQ